MGDNPTIDSTSGIQAVIDQFGIMAAFGRMRGVIVVEFNQEIGKVRPMLAPDALDQLFRGHAVLFGTQHDRSAVGVIGAKVVAFVATQFLEAHPDIGLDVFNQMADVDGTVGVGQGAGDKDAADWLAHGADRCGRSERPLR